MDSEMVKMLKFFYVRTTFTYQEHNFSTDENNLMKYHIYMYHQLVVCHVPRSRSELNVMSQATIYFFLTSYTYVHISPLYDVS